ncbi:MAG: PepSY-associated TM helix domain-containing protein, partial [Pseudomonadota bacterium]
MADKARQIRIYDLHSWTGVCLGIMMFFVCFTGSVALFHHEFEPWEDEARRGEITANPVPIHETLVKFVEENAEGRDAAFVNVSLPHGEHGHYDLFAGYTQEGKPFEAVQARYSATTGEELFYREEGANRLLFNLHRDLSWPEALGGRQIGRIVVGLV